MVRTPVSGKGLENGHVILLNSKDSAYYEQTRQQALSALQAYPGGLQVGGGITAEMPGSIWMQVHPMSL